MIAIIKYNAGNVTSVQNAIHRLGYESVITDNETEILKADKVIFPGVGEAKSAMNYLRANHLDTIIQKLQQPVLGICLGLQLMCKYSEEGGTTCLNIFDTTVKKFPPNEKVPHVGWNNFVSVQGKLFENINLIDDVYYVHSFYAETCSETVATCNYILPFSASLQKGNFYATQFHPEKSASAGEKILGNFLKI
jgi:glutamine amidotransferase